jgi:hydroxymethylpyrimidine/phosphomethylpyrimidine kinase
MLAAKAPALSALTTAASAIANVVAEREKQREFCAGWGISTEELERVPEAAPTTAYGAWLVDVGVRGACRARERGRGLMCAQATTPRS